MRSSRRLFRWAGLVVLGVLAFLLAPIFPHTLYCFDEKMPPPYRPAYIAWASAPWGELFPITHVRFGGRVWLRFWPWLIDEADINENIFLKSAMSVATSEVVVDGVRYPPPPEGVALVEELRKGHWLDELYSCDLAAIGARGVPSGTPSR